MFAPRKEGQCTSSPAMVPGRTLKDIQEAAIRGLDRTRASRGAVGSLLYFATMGSRLSPVASGLCALPYDVAFVAATPAAARLHGCHSSRTISFHWYLWCPALHSVSAYRESRRPWTIDPLAVGPRRLAPSPEDHGHGRSLAWISGQWVLVCLLAAHLMSALRAVQTTRQDRRVMRTPPSLPRRA